MKPNVLPPTPYHSLRHIPLCVKDINKLLSLYSKEMTLIQQGDDTYETSLSLEEVQRAITFLLKERERIKIQGRKRRQAHREANPPQPKEKKVYYQPTGRPRGRPRKSPPADVAPCDSPASPIAQK